MIDLLEPYEEECLFSWGMRMVEWYGGRGLKEKSYYGIKKELFGDKTSSYPHLYFEPYLSTLVERIDLPQSKYWGSVEMILNKMTIFPLYAAFYSEKQYDRAMRKLTEVPIDTWREEIPWFKTTNYYKPDNQLEYKYCPLCMKESGRYLRREHQVPGNDICYKHRIKLQKVAYQRNWKYLSLANLELNTEHVEAILGRKEEIHYEIAKMIHDIFENGFSEMIDITKAKIREKWKELGYLSEKNYFFDFSEVYRDFEFELFFLSEEKAAKAILNIAFHTKVKGLETLFGYLFLIYKLFGTLENFHQFGVSEEKIEENVYPRRMQTKLFLEIKEGKKYLTTVEYAERYGKERKQIRNYCEDGRFSNVVKIRDTWFIPEDTPYPKDKRLIHKEISD